MRARFVLAALLLVAAGGAARAGDVPVTEAQARAALDASKEGAKSKDAKERAAAAEPLARLDHPLVAKELLARFKRETEPSVERAILHALAMQKASHGDVEKRVVAWLAAQAQDVRDREAAGDPGFPFDPASGRTAFDTEAGKKALARIAERGAARLEGIAALDALGRDTNPDVVAWLPFLQDPSDALVVRVLDGLGKAKVKESLHALLDLFRMYPTDATWATGGVTDISGTDATARAKWMVRFGHPYKQKPRPDVFHALSKALVAITGRSFDSPDALAAFLAAADEHKKTRTRAG